MTTLKVDAGASMIDIAWDVGRCQATDYLLLFGSFASVGSYVLDGAECGLGLGGSYAWIGVPPGDLWFLVVGDDGGGTEGTWGRSSDGTHRAGTNASLECGNLSRVNRRGMWAAGSCRSAENDRLRRSGKESGGTDRGGRTELP